MTHAGAEWWCVINTKAALALLEHNVCRSDLCQVKQRLVQSVLLIIMGVKVGPGLVRLMLVKQKLLKVAQ